MGQSVLGHVDLPRVEPNIRVRSRQLPVVPFANLGQERVFLLTGSEMGTSNTITVGTRIQRCSTMESGVTDYPTINPKDVRSQCAVSLRE